MLKERIAKKIWSTIENFWLFKTERQFSSSKRCLFSPHVGIYVTIHTPTFYWRRQSNLIKHNRVFLKNLPKYVNFFLVYSWRVASFRPELLITWMRNRFKSCAVLGATDCVSVWRWPWTAAGSCGSGTAASGSAGGGCGAAGGTAPAAAPRGCPPHCWSPAPSETATCLNLARKPRSDGVTVKKGADRRVTWRAVGLTLCYGHDSRQRHDEVLCLLVAVMGAVDVGQCADRRKTATGARNLGKKEWSKQD